MSTSSTAETRRRSRALGLLAFLATGVVGCGEGDVPRPGSPEYQDAVGAFYTGVAALQVGEDERAEGALSRVTQLAPGEPSAWANLGLLSFQQRSFEEADRRIGEARALGPEDLRVLMLAGLVAHAQGRIDEAIEDVRGAVGAAGPDPRAPFLLARLLEERASGGDVAESGDILDSLAAADTTSAFLRIEVARHAARHGDADALAASVERLGALSQAWPASARTQLERVRATLSTPPEAGTELTFLATTLEALPGYARARETVTVSEQQPDLVLTAFLRMPTPSPRPPPPDLAMRFAATPVDAPAGVWESAVPVWPGGRSAARVGLLGGAGWWIASDGDAADSVTVTASPVASGTAPSLALLDFDHDFRMDAAVVGDRGVRLLRQDSLGRFRAVPAGALPGALRARAFTHVWAADGDMDGDVDLILAGRGAAPVVLANRGDGTFLEERQLDAEVSDARALAWGDLDGDGDPDAAIVDGPGRVHLLANPRQDRPTFTPWDTPAEVGPAAAVALGDLDGDARFDVVVLRRDGTLVRAWRRDGAWHTATLTRWEGFGPPSAVARLFVEDLDNNGALDVVASAGGRSQVWLGDGDHALVAQQTLDVTVTAVADLTGDGRVELLGIDGDGRPVRLTSRTTRDYHALTLVPRATELPGDGRINTFGIGGEAEVRAGMLYQKQPIVAPFVHFGVGDNAAVSVARVLWPNGTAQAEFDLLASQGQPIVAQQRLKGSCPWLFAFDGTAMRFVTDVAWRTALGLRINLYGSTSVIHSEDRVRVRDDQLVARDGAYELSITAELWESHFFDQVELLAVDHPDGTETFVDERFVLPPPDLELHATAPLRPLAGAWDDRGEDVAELVAALDERYLDTFELGTYQGLARREHGVEVDLGPDASAGAPLLLVAQGWVYPTDGSINLAIGQSKADSPRGVRVEVPDGRGGWRVVHQDLGMPSGKTKTVLIDLAGAFTPDTPRRVRLVTTMEIYWDRIAWTEARPATEVRVRSIAPEEADLRWRGFSRTRQAGRKAPELPEYEVAGRARRWADLEGYYTRYGDVRPLLAEVDDRYVIMNAGDELLLRFSALADPPAGWVRDYVLVSDAWVKDGDLNNGFSGTLRPLPYHGLTDYARAPVPLEDDPAYRLHPDDWRVYHTRWVGHAPFRDALATRPR